MSDAVMPESGADTSRHEGKKDARPKPHAPLSVTAVLDRIETAVASVNSEAQPDAQQDDSGTESSAKMVGTDSADAHINELEAVHAELARQLSQARL